MTNAAAKSAGTSKRSSTTSTLWATVTHSVVGDPVVGELEGESVDGELEGECVGVPVDGELEAEFVGDPVDGEFIESQCVWYSLNDEYPPLPSSEHDISINQ